MIINLIKYCRILISIVVLFCVLISFVSCTTEYEFYQNRENIVKLEIVEISGNYGEIETFVKELA